MRDSWWHPYDEVLGKAIRSSARLLYGRDGARMEALREGAGVRELAPKVETADEAEDVTQRRAAATAQVACDRELRVRRQHELRPASGAVGGG